MCGIFGFIDKENKIPVEQRKLLASLNISRGENGAGLVAKGKKISMYKSKENVLDLICLEDDYVNGLWGEKILLGHTRRASNAYGIGGVSNENAHPFHEHGITAAHNGFVSNWKGIQKELDKNYKVDSEIFPAIINKDINMLSKVTGKAAVWWVKEKDPNVYIWVWNQVFALAMGDGYCAFSSEAEHLKGAGFDQAYEVDSGGQVIKIKPNGEAVCISEIKGSLPPPPKETEWTSWGTLDNWVPSQEIDKIRGGGKVDLWNRGAQVSPKGRESVWLDYNAFYTIFRKDGNEFVVIDKKAFKKRFPLLKENGGDRFSEAVKLLSPKLWECSHCGETLDDSDVVKYRMTEDLYYHKESGCMGDSVPIRREDHILSLALALSELSDSEYVSIVSFLEDIMDGRTEGELAVSRSLLREASEFADKNYNCKLMENAQ